MADPQLPVEHADDPEEVFPADDPGAVIHDDEQDVEEGPDLVEPDVAMFGFLAAATAAPPSFTVPLDCKDHPDIGHYRGTTYPGHSSFSVDVNAVDGHDIGDSVFASADGYVYSWEPGNGDMRIRHAGGYRSWYVHMQHPKVAVGDKVKCGQQIAELGNAGIGSTGPHLHVNHAGPDGKQIQVVWDGVPYPISVSPNTKNRVGPLIEGHCPEVDMPTIQLAKEFELLLTAGTVVLRDPRSGADRLHTIPAGVALPRQYGVVEGVPGWRAVVVDMPDDHRRIGFVPNTVGTRVARPDPYKAGRKSMQDDIVLLASGVEP